MSFAVALIAGILIGLMLGGAVFGFLIWRETR